MARPRRPPDRVAGTLQHVLQRIDPERRLGAYRLWTFWDEEVGAAVAAHAQPAAFRDGVLSVRVDGAAWMQELQFLKDDVRARLNARLGAPLIRDIYFVSGRVDAPRQAAPPPPADDGAAEEPIALPSLRDPRLAEVLTRIVRAHRRRGRAGE